MTSDMRLYETFYGIHTDDWTEDFGSFSSHHKILVKEYLSDGCSCTEDSVATSEIKFLYPHHISKVFFLEGVIQGHITLAASGATSTVTSYEVIVGKVHTDGTETELFTTGTVTVNDTLDWDSTYSIGEEMVYPFWIDAWTHEEIKDYERLYVEIKVSADKNAVLWHSNDATWEDFKITIPLVV